MTGRGKAAIEPIIVLIDGQCNLCHGITRFVIQRDPAGQFKFASIQSEIGQRLLEAGGLSGRDLDTFVMLEDGRYYTKSTAALRMFRRLGGLWRLTYGLRVVPLFIRNRVYDLIASRRYRWFGYNDSCLVPTKEIKKRFLDEAWGVRQDDT